MTRGIYPYRLSVRDILRPKSNNDCCVVISALKTERGLALQDLLNGAYEYIDELELKPNSRIYLLDSLATTE